MFNERADEGPQTELLRAKFLQNPESSQTLFLPVRFVGALISDAFKNWRGMAESGGQRIKRATYIDMSTIRLCDAAMLVCFERIHLLQDYLKAKREDIAAYNTKHNFDEDCLLNGRRLTNIGTYRAYIIAFLRQHPMINQEITFLVRQLAPTSKGLPLDIYVFSKDKVWANYKAIQADIFDHLLAVMPGFGLHVYQQPAGTDFRALAEHELS